MNTQTSYREKELLAEIANSSETAFTELFDLYRDRLYTFLFRLTGSNEMTEDVIQDIFLRLWNSRERLPEIEKLSSYLIRSAQNHVFNAFRKQARETLLIAGLKHEIGLDTPGIEDKMEQEAVQQKLKVTIEMLPAQQKMVYQLSRDAGLKYEEIAERMGLSRNTVRNHMTRALQTIREQLGPYLHTVAGATLVLQLIDAFQR